MKHHLPEEWLIYMEGEASPELAVTLAAHLKSCPECAAELAGWQRSAGKLRQLNFPAPTVRARTPAFAAVKWAVAAGIAIFIGVAAGRATVPNAEALRQSITAQARSEMHEELQRELARVAQEFDIQRKADEQRMLAVINSVRDQDFRDCLALRQDLETAVSVADTDLRANNRRLNEIAVVMPQNQK